MRAHVVAAIAIACSAGGCFAHVEDRCRECAIVRSEQPAAAPIQDDARALVVLVHGAFGFGAEWEPILAALRARPELAYFAYAWRGPIGGRPPDPADGFLEAMQLTIDRLPRSVREVLVLAHSAGGGIADYAVRRIKLPEGVRMRVALLDPETMLAPYQPLESIATPFGTGAGVSRVEPPPLPAQVEEARYRALDPPKRGATEERIGNAEVVRYLGRRVTHGGAVALAGLPLLHQLAKEPVRAREELARGQDPVNP